MTKKNILFFFEPKLVPVTDSDGNIISYKNIPCRAMSLKDSKDLRVITSCAERGLSADRSDVTGFRATLDTINVNRDSFGVSIQPIGYDDLSVVSACVSSGSKLI